MFVAEALADFSYLTMKGTQAEDKVDKVDEK